MNTYRERLQALIEQLRGCYDEVGVLRDYSDGNLMKDPLNKTRGLLNDALRQLQKLDDVLPDGHASMKTAGKGFCK